MIQIQYDTLYLHAPKSSHIATASPAARNQ